MNTSEARSMALRLLELQQRFESYVILHEEELREIKATLSEMRRDVVHLSQSSEPKPRIQDETSLRPPAASQDGDEKVAEADEISSMLTL